MPKTLILYDTRTGNTDRMARAVAEGAKSVDGVEVVLKRVAEGSGELADADGIILGVLPDMLFEEKQITLSSGDVLVMYTDGITEGQNLAGEQFGEQRLYRVIAEIADDPAQAIADGILSAARVHGRGVDQYDDISLIVMKVAA